MKLMRPVEVAFGLSGKSKTAHQLTEVTKNTEGVAIKHPL
jgi:hypothetical protein